ncbi:MAG TPA: bifunctional glutamate N-acetyltransferase/amino-acid acetyltransferase ArgJ [Bacillota bacterium]|nr:bifunctional glutamate N-acetyltransferase/amino-acid acetyltransferase ArgJ [Bacillota bacterium]HOL09135.1 bifunctional glutamate N-acetyltransferase/amino-acid acetyltransferase ArgJ [Bacillota bacterium]HPO97192.1 bifunctional glutamate N-acetyltransferase/amino-acid acetyltransferase ArgJ [Bacillota bacterium]
MKQIAGGVTAPKGYLAGGIACGIKKTGTPDLAIIASEVPAKAAAVFTKNKVQAAPIAISKQHLQNGEAQAIIVNSGNANACVGPIGDEIAVTMCQAAADYLNIAAEQVLVASTGVIGVPLPVEKIVTALSVHKDILSKQGSVAAATAIMTTDTFMKEVAVEFELEGTIVTIGGIAKGSGMIHPNMATMLGFITTDVAIEQPLLQKALSRACDLSFNRVTVDGDTSTNDSLFVLANGMAGNKIIDQVDKAYSQFVAALEYVCLELAKMLARDGEGATKFIEIQVNGAKNEHDAVTIAKSIATSSLVKTALFGEDANWGRILCAAGYSGVDFDPDQVSIALGDLLVYQNGVGIVFDEAKAKTILSQHDIVIRLEIGAGNAAATVWTCDFSYDYVKINGSYRT